MEIGGKRTHVITYLGDFLFPPERARSPVSSLSGGERNRLLLARLFAQPANVLVLDEPTNDLDIDTLELLEALLQDYAGTLFLVSHDRAFLDNVVTQTIAFEGDGLLREYAGGFSDWADYHARRNAQLAEETQRHGREAAPSRACPAGADERASPQLQRAARTRRTAGTDRVARRWRPRACATVSPTAPSIAKARRQSRRCRTSSRQREAELAAAYARWEALETRNSALAATLGEH